MGDGINYLVDRKTDRSILSRIVLIEKIEKKKIIVYGTTSLKVLDIIRMEKVPQTIFWQGCEYTVRKYSKEGEVKWFYFYYDD